MIQIIFGLPRSGKTTLLTAIARKANLGKRLKFGSLAFGSGVDYERVYTNFACSDCFQLDFEALGKVNYHDCLILIDEVSLLCDSRNYKTFSDNLKFFFALHGHFNIDIICCSQSYMDCDVKIRRMATDFFLVEKTVLERSIIRRIIQILDVENSQIKECYELSPLWRSAIINRKKYYDDFDSFSKPELPEPEICKW